MKDIEKTIKQLETMVVYTGLVRSDREALESAIKILKEKNRTIIRFKSIRAAKRFMRKVKRGEIIVNVESVKE